MKYLLATILALLCTVNTYPSKPSAITLPTEINIGDHYHYLGKKWEIAGFRYEIIDHGYDIILYLERPITFLNVEFARKHLVLSIEINGTIHNEESIRSITTLHNHIMPAVKTYVVCGYLVMQTIKAIFSKPAIHKTYNTHIYHDNTDPQKILIQ